MPVNEASEILALSLIFVVHVAGGLELVWGMLEGDARPARGGAGAAAKGPTARRATRRRPPAPAAPRRCRCPAPSPSRVRLRDETPLRDAYERPARRPQRTPDRSPSRR